MEKEIITLGTTSALKINALEEACKILELNVTVKGVRAYSGQNDQPVDFDETYAGALARAQKAREQNPDTVAVGIESGIFRFAHNSLTLDIAIVVILTKDNREIVTTSPGIIFPEKYVRESRKRGLKTVTVGQIIHEKTGSDKKDPHSGLTNGKVSRMSTLVDGLIVALKQI